MNWEDRLGRQLSWKGDYAGDGTLRVGRVDLVCSRVRKVHPAGLREEKEAVRPAKSEKTEEIREKEVPCGSERGKRDRETRKKRKNGSKKEKRAHETRGE